MGGDSDNGETVMKSFLYITLTICLFFNVGCRHDRFSVFGTIGGEMHKVTTRNRYTLVGVRYEGGGASADVVRGNLQTRSFSNYALKRFQPDVFSDNGIRVLLRSTPLPSVKLFSWTLSTYMCSLGVLPLCGSTGEGEHLVVEVLDNPDARAVLDMCRRLDSSSSLLSPISLLFFWGNAIPLCGIEMPLILSRHACIFEDMSFGMYDNINEEARAYLLAATLRKMEDDGLIDELRIGKMERSAIHSADVDKKFEIVTFRRDGDCEHRYVFMLRSRDSVTVSLSDSRELKKSLRSMIREDYLASFPDVNVDSLIVDFPEFSLCDGVVNGKSDVLSLSVESLRYDSSTRMGTMRVRIGENQFAEARQYARRNVESLVRDKNIALGAHDIPLAATFYILDEKAEGHVLEITFKTE